MRIIFFTHPAFLKSQSMPRYAKWLMDGMQERGHDVTQWEVTPFFYKIPLPGSLKKWLGYLDQYVVFPWKVRIKMRSVPADTLFVFTDQALGPWVPLAAGRHHIIHCHDFLAQRSALGEIPEVKVGMTGRLYQDYIYKGYKKGRNFISISENTKKDLHHLLGRTPEVSEVVYNGLTQSFSPADDIAGIRKEIGQETGVSLDNGYLLHVGGNQWYKNRRGVIEIYNQWRQSSNVILPLIMIGAQPGEELKMIWQTSPYKDDIHLLTGKPDLFVKKAYAGASLFLFPSFEEGFGWPLIEAMASGCPVLTTNEAPMNEVGADAVLYIKRKPSKQEEQQNWAIESAAVIDHFFSDEWHLRREMAISGHNNLKRFDARNALDRIEGIYKGLFK